jgi:hypothetical protein
MPKTTICCDEDQVITYDDLMALDDAAITAHCEEVCGQ